MIDMKYGTENQSLEFKSKIGKKNAKNIASTLCAFANSGGGKLVVGVSDDGKIIGINKKNIDSIQQSIENIIQEYLSPIPLHKINLERIGNKVVVSVDIYQIDGFCTSKGKVYFRFGSENRILEGKTLQDFMIHRKILLFDTSKSSATIDDIDMKKVKSYLVKRGSYIKTNKIKDALISLNLIKKNGGLWVTNACALFFSKKVTQFIPQSNIKLVLFKGITPVEITDNRFIEGSPLDILNSSLQFIMKYIPKKIVIKKIIRQEIPLIPESVIRELLVNALVHRDYFNQNGIQVNIFDDRIEIINPGRLPEGLSLSMLGTISIQRNPLTYMIMRDYGLVEGLGTGIPRVRETLKKLGLPYPLFEELGNFFRVTVYLKSLNINPFERWIVDYLSKNHSITSKKLAELKEVSKPTAVKMLNHLVKKGLLKRHGKTRGAYYSLNR